MNRALLLLVCDFIILSLLALANFETAGAGKQEMSEQRVEIETIKSEQDLIDALKLALEDEIYGRQELTGDLDETQRTLQEREETLAERETRIEALAADLERREQERLALEDRVTQTEAEKELLAEAREQQAEEARRAREQALRMEQLLRERLAELERAQQNLTLLEAQQREAEEAARRLSTELELSDREKQIIRENLEFARAEVAIVRGEKARLQEQSSQLAHGVTTLAERSGELADEVRRIHAKTSAAIFNDFQANQIMADFRAERTRALGQSIDREMETRSILVTDGEKIYALFHIESTGIGLRETEDWQRLAGRLSRSRNQERFYEISFLSIDPRIAFVEVPAQLAEALGTEPYPLAQDPFRFPDAVLINNQGNNYGESSFTLNAAHPNYVRMPRRIFGRLFGGEFSPSKGDLVFSKTGEFIGMMVNDEYCVLIDNFMPAANIDFRNPRGSGRTLIRMQQRVDNLSQRLRM